MRCIFLVIDGGSPHYDSLGKVQRSTWVARNQNHFPVVFVRGGGEMAGYQWDAASHTLSVPCEEKFSHILLKTVLALRWVLERFEPDYVIRTNNSSHWNLRGVLDTYATAPRKQFYGGYLGFVEVGVGRDLPEGKLPFVSGAGLWLSGDLAKRVASSRGIVALHPDDDVAVALYMRQIGVMAHRLDRSDITEYGSLRTVAHSRLKHLSRPPQAGRRLTQLDKASNLRSSLGITLWAVAYTVRELISFWSEPRKTLRQKLGRAREWRSQQRAARRWAEWVSSTPTSRQNFL